MAAAVIETVTVSVPTVVAPATATNTGVPALQWPGTVLSPLTVQTAVPSTSMTNHLNYVSFYASDESGGWSGSDDDNTLRSVESEMLKVGDD